MVVRLAECPRQEPAGEINSAIDLCGVLKREPVADAVDVHAPESGSVEPRAVPPRDGFGLLRRGGCDGEGEKE